MSEPTSQTAAADFTEIEVTILDSVGTVIFDRPDALNAITPTMLGELNEAFDALAADDEVRVVVLTGSGRAFSAGVDLKALGDRELVNGKVGDILDVPARRLTGLMTSMPKPVIGKINGFCFTGALELALACDVLVVADEAKIGDTHAKFGIRPTWGLSQRLPARIGVAKARMLSYTARTFTGVEAERWGLAAISVPRDDLDETVAALAAEMVVNSAQAFAAYKDLYAKADQVGIDEGLAYEAASEYTITDTAERLKGFR